MLLAQVLFWYDEFTEVGQDSLYFYESISVTWAIAFEPFYLVS